MAQYSLVVLQVPLNTNEPTLTITFDFYSLSVCSARLTVNIYTKSVSACDCLLTASVYLLCIHYVDLVVLDRSPFDWNFLLCSSPPGLKVLVPGVIWAMGKEYSVNFCHFIFEWHAEIDRQTETRYSHDLKFDISVMSRQNDLLCVCVCVRTFVLYWWPTTWLH